MSDSVRKVGGSRRSADQVQVSISLPDLENRLQAMYDRLDDLRPDTQPPTGFRWKTRAEYAAEYQDAATTAGRRQQLLAIRCGLLPRETVALV